ncbi:MAG TPA: ABC transporter substrate-binding protein [Desulfobulbaceae bacterium]|nr:ABC transporter substrate-binding protein [Desulfobulbaceae bacterium]
MVSMITRLVFSLFCCATFLLPNEVHAKEILAWMEAVAPPFFIHEGPYKGQGYEDLITDILKESLPQYDHKHMQANISRHYQQWKQGENACSVGMFKTPERLEFTYFSIPSVFTLPTVLIIHKDRFEAFGGKKTVSLAELLKEGKLMIGRSSNRSYGIEFDTALNTYGNSKNIFKYEGPELSLNLFKMLQAGRIDALPGLPEEAMYLAETMGIRDQIITLAVEENQANKESWLSYVACSKTEWGKKVIEEINQALIELRPTEKYRAAYERWLDPSTIEGYRKLYQEEFVRITE